MVVLRSSIYDCDCMAIVSDSHLSGILTKQAARCTAKASLHDLLLENRLTRPGAREPVHLGTLGSLHTWRKSEKSQQTPTVMGSWLQGSLNTRTPCGKTLAKPYESHGKARTTRQKKKVKEQQPKTLQATPKP